MTGKWLRQLAVPVALLGIGLAPGTSRATLIFTQSPVSPLTNLGDVQVLNPATGANLLELGTPNTDTVLVNTGTTGVIINAGGAGAAFFSAATTAAPFTTLVFTPIAPITGFTAFEVNPGPGTTGTFQVTAVDNQGDIFTFNPVTAGPGENRFAVVGLDNQLITRVTLTGTFPSIRQVRVATGPAAVIPEPSTVSMALTAIGIGCLAGFRKLRRQRRQAVA